MFLEIRESDFLKLIGYIEINMERINTSKRNNST